MTAAEALRAQIAKNLAILRVVDANCLPGTKLSREGQDYKVREITEINAGLQAALLIIDPPPAG